MAPSPKKKAKINAENELTTTLNLSTDILNWSKLELSKQTLKAINFMGFKSPTEIQEKIIPLALKGIDILGAAETGSGKTLAFAIPILEKWIMLSKNNDDCLFAIVIAPTRELALQVEKEVKCLSSFTSQPCLRSMALFGGLSQQKQERLLKKKPHIIVGTPGRLWSLINNNAGYLEDLSNVKILVVDEVDRMLERGHFQELDHIVAKVHSSVKTEEVKNVTTSTLQTLIFSATLTFTHAPVMRKDGTFSTKQSKTMKIKNLIELMRLREEKQIVDLTLNSAMPETLVECRMHCDNLKQKDVNLYYLLHQNKGRTLVFTNSIDCARRLFNLLRVLKFQPSPCILHAKMTEKNRLKNLEKFTETKNAVLIATDIAARGLDVNEIVNVIHYQVPKTSEAYVHRSGRTARASKKGLSVLFVDPADVQFYKRIRKNLNWNKDLEVLLIDSPKLYEVCLYRVNIAAQLESVEFNLKKKCSRNEWFKQLAEEADIVLDDDIFRIDGNDENGSKESPAVLEMRLKRKNLKKVLNAALRLPVIL